MKKQHQELINEDLYDKDDSKKDDLFQEEKKIWLNMKLKNKIRGIKIKNQYYIFQKVQVLKIYRFLITNIKK